MRIERVALGLAVGGGFALLLFVLERARPLRATKRALFGRLFVNLALATVALAVASLVLRPAVAVSLGRIAERPFGLVPLAGLPGAPGGALAFLLMDLSFYYWHRLNHRVPFLWRFHNVHHIDPDLDVSTAVRFHFGEIVFSAVFRVLQIVLIGVSAWTFLAYELIFQANTLFHHSNVRIPIGLERVLGKFLVTPRMHGIHHSEVESETNSNYGVVFPWWDRLHRTLGLNVPQATITVGVPAYSSAEDNRLRAALALPFRKQRDYWRRADGSAVIRDAAREMPDRGRLAE